MRLVGHCRDFHDIGIERFQPGVKVAKVVRRVAKAVITDDSFRLAEPRYLVGDVVFQIDVLDSVGDCLAEHDHPRFFAAGVFAAVYFPTNGDHRRTRPVFEQPLDIYPRADVIQPQLDQLGPLLYQMGELGQHVFMTAAAYADANHWRELRVSRSGVINAGEVYFRRTRARNQIRLNCRSRSSRVKTREVGRPCGQ